MDKEKKEGGTVGSEEGRNDRTLENLIELGKFYYINKKFDEAMEQFVKALDLDPDNEQVLMSIGLIHEVHNEPEKAKEVYQKILKKNPENSAARDKLNKLSGL